MQLRRADVVAGAMAILDEYGLGDLTMRRLATSLGVQPGALYWHFPNKQSLLGAIADEILRPMDSPAPGGAWDERLDRLAARMRDCLLAHRDGAELVAAAYAARLTTSGARGVLAATLADAGLDDAHSGLAADSLLYYILGHAMDEQSRAHLDSHGALPDGASPLFETPDATSRFEYGLGLFVDGVRSRVSVS